MPSLSFRRARNPDGKEPKSTPVPQRIDIGASPAGAAGRASLDSSSPSPTGATRRLSSRFLRRKLSQSQSASSTDHAAAAAPPPLPMADTALLPPLPVQTGSVAEAGSSSTSALLVAPPSPPLTADPAPPFSFAPYTLADQAVPVPAPEPSTPEKPPPAPNPNDYRFHTVPRRGSEPLSNRRAWVYARPDDTDPLLVSPQAAGSAAVVTRQPFNFALPRTPSPDPDVRTSPIYTPVYPTALSPPRRSMPRSPRAAVAAAQRSSEPRNLRVPGSAAHFRRASSPTPSLESGSSRGPSPALIGVGRSGSGVTAEWLAEKPGGRARKGMGMGASSEPQGQRQGQGLGTLPTHAESPDGVVLHADRAIISPAVKRSLEPAFRGHRKTPSNGSAKYDSPNYPYPFNRPAVVDGTSDSSFGSASESVPSSGSEREMDVGRKPRASLGLGRRDNAGPYEVQVTCSDTTHAGQEDLGDGEEEIKWEITIRRRRPQGSAVAHSPSASAPGPLPAPGPASPMPLGPGVTLARSPLAASSINLSLSLDAPTGKLVWVAFPTDLHATPTRPRPGSGSVFGSGSGHGPGSGSAGGRRHQPRSSLTGTSSFASHLASSAQKNMRASHSLGSGSGSQDALSLSAAASSTPPSLPPPAPGFALGAPHPITPTQPGRADRRSAQWSSASPRSSLGQSQGLGRSPPASPRDSMLINQARMTPRRSRILNATELDGGLFAKGTVDGLSEELEAAHLQSAAV